MPSKSARSAGRARTQVPRCTSGLTVSLLRQTERLLGYRLPAYQVSGPHDVLDKGP